MRRWFKSTRMVAFVAPVAVVMADDGGCSSTSQKPMDEQQVRATLIGNTAFNETAGAVAFIDANGTIRAEISQTDAIKTDVGNWTLDETGRFCVDWTETEHGKDNCSSFVQVQDDKLQWGGQVFSIKSGNTENL